MYFWFSWITRVLSSLAQRLALMRQIRMSILFFFLLWFSFLTFVINISKRLVMSLKIMYMVLKIEMWKPCQQSAVFREWSWSDQQVFNKSKWIIRWPAHLIAPSTRVMQTVYFKYCYCIISLPVQVCFMIIFFLLFYSILIMLLYFILVFTKNNNL